MAADNQQRAAVEAERAAAAAAEAAERHKAAAKQVKTTATVLTAAAKFRRTLHKGKSLTYDVDKQVGLPETPAQELSTSRVQLNIIPSCGSMRCTHPAQSKCF